MRHEGLGGMRREEQRRERGKEEVSLAWIPKCSCRVDVGTWNRGHPR